MKDKDYAELLLELCPRPVRTKAAYEKMQKKVQTLMQKKSHSKAERDVMELLFVLLEQFEAKVLPKHAPARTLSRLMELKPISQAELARETGISESIVSEVLRERRQFSKSTANTLSEFFGVSVGAFIARESKSRPGNC